MAKINNGLFTSKTDNWSTPIDFYKELNKEFNFQLNPCCSSENQKCNFGYTVEDDGLSQNWTQYGAVFMNPPYGRVIKDWMEKAHKTAQSGTTVVCLVPARTDTRWFQDYCIEPGYEIRYIRGRLKFGESTNSAPFPSAVIIMKKTDGHSPDYDKGWAYGVWFACERLVSNGRADLAEEILVSSQLEEAEFRQVLSETQYMEEQMNALLGEVFEKAECEYCQTTKLRRDLQVITGEAGRCGTLACYDCRLKKEVEEK